MPKTVTSIGDAAGLGCCILGLDVGRNLETMDDLLSISGPDDDAWSIDDPGDPEPFISDFDPVFIPPSEPPLAIPEPGPGGSLTVKPKGWRADGSYSVQGGDTLAGLSRLYLGDAGRFREIWNLQADSYRARRTPDRIVVGDVLAMPPEAIARARELGAMRVGSAPPAPAPPVVAAAPPKAASATPQHHKVALGIASALAAGVALLLWRPPHSARPRATGRHPR